MTLATTTTTTDTANKTSAEAAEWSPDALLPVTADHETPPRADRAARRTFTEEYKRALFTEYDATPLGTKGAVLRRDLLYDSHIKERRAVIEACTLGKVTKKPQQTTGSAEKKRIAELERPIEKSRVGICPERPDPTTRQQNRKHRARRHTNGVRNLSK